MNFQNLYRLLDYDIFDMGYTTMYKLKLKEVYKEDTNLPYVIYIHSSITRLVFQASDFPLWPTDETYLKNSHCNLVYSTNRRSDRDNNINNNYVCIA